jgi:hypothetical protein
VEITAEADWKQRAAGLVAELVAAGVLSDPAWVAAFAGVPRHVFTPTVRDTDGTTLDAGQPRWWDAVDHPGFLGGRRFWKGSRAWQRRRSTR